MTKENPYRWRSNVVQVQVPRPQVEGMAESLAAGESIVLLGGRGMGKSVLLGQLQARLAEIAGVVALTIPGPPPELTVRSCLDRLAHALGVPAGADDSRQLLDAFFAEQPSGTRLVILFDEFDNYAEVGPQPSNRPAGRAFFNDLETSRRSLPELGLMAAGSIGVYVFRDVLGSSFLSRADSVRLSPFELADIRDLSQPFSERGTPLSESVLSAIQATTGGVAALVAYGFQALWERHEPLDAYDVAEVFQEFFHTNRGYLNDIRHSMSHPRLSEAPQRVWTLIKQAHGRIPRSDLVAACQESEGILRLDLADVLDILQASGLVRVESRFYTADPVIAYPRASLLNLPETSASVDFRHQLRDDLRRLLEMLHRSAADFFRPGRDQRKQLVPESVFAASLVLGFELLDWRSEREAQSAAGRTDIKLWHNGSPESAIVEIKIWGRNDYKDAQQQLESYWAHDVKAGAVVMLTDADLSDWPTVYRRECLAGLDVDNVDLGDSPLRALLSSGGTGREDSNVDHFLVQLPVR